MKEDIFCFSMKVCHLCMSYFTWYFSLSLLNDSISVSSSHMNEEIEWVGGWKDPLDIQSKMFYVQMVWSINCDEQSLVWQLSCCWLLEMSMMIFRIHWIKINFVLALKLVVSIKRCIFSYGHILAFQF